MNCNFLQPVNYLGLPPEKGDPFAFSQMVCDGTIGEGSTIEQINGTGNFWIAKQLDYGQVLILTFLLIFFVGFVVKFLWNFNKQDSDQKL
ncbi:MAG: hypothetical protein A2402_01780 [Candidatus Staskawiczbacteria bacterium RIFOXYC1_FULL_37_43]|nr:MAG: hypothetical protein A2813_01695 [Candidatus Staskawiczbacteria bacterium RIFCSPHIGHO2_01_FULL_37_17]OGZ72173.1 MAG: hypothetical protein A2891_02130 [Candidatus Staskawiczbacteria bacterium RIFCSPLOWO2_01_FULL_37_19]OGZ75458.1 MAG: hypothetical protein A2205_01615 [Candidatus Staskawiczbacteria bacterium RIFOXYA1_FULL_37_15]OGZ77944.1 MAG: hypothetical protein A2280_02630 [Candidatus Staskawiczbacteria bacterium RIFOXYA12_FULL_37_10]OGZ80446.1 MAG: hypothetical protein A2353_02880 [Can